MVIKTCKECKNEIIPGMKYLRWKGENYCSECGMDIIAYALNAAMNILTAKENEEKGRG